MRFRGLAEAGVVALLAAGLTVVLTYPLALHLDRLGRLQTDDGRLSIWNVAWVAHALTTAPLGVYDANIFYPHTDALAFSEANLGAGVLAVPAWLATGNPYTAHNTVVLLSFVLAVAGGYYLGRYLTGSRAAGAVAGVLFAFCPYIFARTAHIQLLMTAGLPFAMLAFHRLVDRQTVGRAVTLGLVLWAQALSCAYYGIFAALAVGLATLVFAVSRGLWRRRDYWIAIGLAAFVSLALTGPFFLPYLRIQEYAGFARTLDDARMYSANGGAWLASSAWAHRWWLGALGSFNEVLFPGILLIGLGVAGAVIGWRARVPVEAPTGGRRPAGPPRDVIAFYVALAVLAFWASFGPAAGLYTLLFDTIPVFSFLRAPARMGLIVSLCLSALAAISVARIVAGRRRGALIGAALVVAAAAELMTAPLTTLREAEPVAPAYRVLATLPAAPVAEFPFFYRRSDFPRHAYYMLNSTTHWMPLVNGYSDHIPADFRRNVVPLSSFPSRESFGILARIGARYVVFHLDLYDHRLRARLMDRLETYAAYLRPLVQEGDVWLYEIVDWPN
ncbi:MAG: hypothetical protein AB7H88_20450 [Vicinamibacterales bacterium]